MCVCVQCLCVEEPLEGYNHIEISQHLHRTKQYNICSLRTYHHICAHTHTHVYMCVVYVGVFTDCLPQWQSTVVVAPENFHTQHRERKRKKKRDVLLRHLKTFILEVSTIWSARQWTQCIHKKKIRRKEREEKINSISLPFALM